ncbi:MAG: hypothetical protein AAGA77_05875, partial [Bacteroidota bacterium]
MRQLKIRNVLLLFIFSLIIQVALIGQYKSLDFEISMSPYFDDRIKSVPSDAEFWNIIGISQFGLGYSTQIGKKLVLSPRLAWGVGREMYQKGTLNAQPIKFPSSTNFYSINRKATFLKMGLACSYWFQHVGIGWQAESELQTILPLTARSEEIYQEPNEYPREFSNQYKEEFRGFVPSLKVGIGYNLPIKRIVFFLRIGFELRMS